MSRTDARLTVGLTEAGKTILVGIGFVALTALVFPAFGVLAALVWVMITALVVGLAVRPRIQVTGNFPDRIVAGQTVKLTYTLKNLARLPAYHIWLGWDYLPGAIEQVAGTQLIRRLAPGETAEVTIEIRAARRGHYRIRHPVCQSSFPFNLLRFGVTQGGQDILIVLPQFFMLRIPAGHLSRNVRSGGAKLGGRTGVFPEYAGNRPYLPGDSPRRIDARAWARLSVPVSKEYHDDFDNYTALVLDTGVPRTVSVKDSDQIAELEAAVCLCASVAFTINDACLIDLLVAGKDFHQFTGLPRKVRLDRIHETLASVEPSGNDSIEQVTPALADKFSEISEVFFILLNWTEAQWRLVELAGQAGCHCTVLLVDGTERPEGYRDDLGRLGDVQVLSAADILAGQITQL